MIGQGVVRLEDSFGPELAAKIDGLRLILHHPGLRVEAIDGPDGGRSAVAYLDGVASPATVRAVRRWARSCRPGLTALTWWQAVPQALRLPSAVEHPGPAAVADALRRGYVTVLADHLSEPLVAPTTLELLLTAPWDAQLSPALRRLSSWPRLLATLTSLLFTAAVVAITSYHHAQMPGPFLLALASSRQNPPLPIVAEVLLVELVGDGLRSALNWNGGRQWTLLACIATILAAMLGLQAGVLGPLPAFAGLSCVVAFQAVPSPILRRMVRYWRFIFIGAAAGLGLMGMALLGFALLVYLGEERPFGHPLRLPPSTAGL